MKNAPAAADFPSEPSRRKQRGAYYTPPEIARHISRLTLEPLLGETPAPTVLDPACGDGAFLLSAAALLAEHCGAAAASARGELAMKCLFGGDIDAGAVADCRRRMAEWVVGNRAGTEQQQTWIARLESNIVHGNALLAAADSAASGIDVHSLAIDFKRRFDCVVGNPPYVNIRLASRTLDPKVREYYRKRYRSARGAYDLYVLFLERACELVRPGGRFGWIVPNKLAGAGYASACRALLASETTIDRWEDWSSERVFAEAGVYPMIISGWNRPPKAGNRVVTRRPDSTGETSIPIASLGQPQWRFSASLDVESRVETVPLGELATLHSGATGFQAQRLAGELIEADELAEGTAAYTFITSGNIDRYRIDDQHVRFMKRRFGAARLPVDSALLTENKRQLYAAPKIVIAGMTRRLEAAYDRSGRALGVQVYAAVDCGCDPYYLLGVLNSRLISDLFRQRFASKQLAGGYLAINKAQLVQLPIARPGQMPSVEQQIAFLARRLCRVRNERKAAEADDQLDQCVGRLYGLSCQPLHDAAGSVKAA